MPQTTDSRLSDEAIDLLVRREFGTLAPAEFAAWRARSPQHEAAARQAEALWREVGETGIARAFAAEGLPRAVRHPPPRRASLGRRGLLAGALAASAAAVTLGTGALGPVAGLLSDHVTRVGERRRIGLPDGTAVLLNTSSALSIRYTDGERGTTLDAGEAFFDVAADPSRAFVVRAGEGLTRARDAAFALRRAGGEVAVVVARGTVDVEAGGLVGLSAGQGLVLGPGRAGLGAQTVDVASATAWRNGKLIFNQRPLAEVAAEIERYRVGRVVVANARLRSLPVTGVFNLDDLDGVLDSIERILSIEVVRLPLLTLLR